MKSKEIVRIVKQNLFITVICILLLILYLFYFTFI